MVPRSVDRGQHRHFCQNPLLQIFVGHVLGQGVEAVRVFDRVAADDLPEAALCLRGPIPWVSGVGFSSSLACGGVLAFFCAGVPHPLPVGRETLLRNLLVSHAVQFDEGVSDRQHVAVKPVAPCFEKLLENEVNELPLVVQAHECIANASQFHRSSFRTPGPSSAALRSVGVWPLQVSSARP